jgi:sodium-dependent dicarboxylate transporter 2/3/5
MTIKQSAFLLGPLLAIFIPWMIEIPDHPHAAAMLGLALWMAIWWICECIPLAVTALIPLMMFPLAGITTGKEIAPRYVNSIIFLFLGGFLIAQAMEVSNLHRRIALTLLNRWHASPLQLAAGFSLTTAFLSMWISNTATTMLMVTIALPLIHRLSEEHGKEKIAPVAAAFLLIIAYSANIGGMGTPVGTAPNMVFLEIMNTYAPRQTPSFLQWMVAGVPMVAAGLGVLFLLVGRKLAHLPWQESDATALRDELEKLGGARREEKTVAWVLGITAVAWMTRQGIQTDGFTLPGWSSLLPYGGVDDGTVAMIGAGSLFLLRGENGKTILQGRAFGRLPWDIVLLLGGGFALAHGMQASGLSQWVGEQLSFLANIPLPVMMLGIVLAITFLTEITSNTAITQVMLPILAATALGNNLDLVLVLLPATLAASCAFMLPVATPPNAIVFGSKQIPMETMVQAGIRLNLVMAVVIVAIALMVRPAFS